ncbi:MAG TPA: ABC transporter ATP-binding protein [Acidimicrobiia bacterium]|nr:ABC transporter ATP-binding protein [Acidimicrobiia bacterium]
MTAVDARAPVDPGNTAGRSVITLRGVEKHFPIKEGALQRVVGQVRAVDGVSFEVRPGETLGLVGESGCGKTTLGRCISGLVRPTGGGIYFRLSDEDAATLDEIEAIPVDSRTPDQAGRIRAIDSRHRIGSMGGQAWRTYRRNCQVVFQDSFSSLNPRQLVKDIVGRPLKVYKEASGAALTDAVVSLLESVGLGRQHLFRYPHQFSGGQRQRISIARALALDPEFIVLDEPTSALDVSVQAQILNLLHELQEERGLTYLFISHDLGVVRLMSDRISVMYLGQVAEQGTAEELFVDSRHPYTQALVAANPDINAEPDEEMKGLEGTVPDPANPPEGCRFHTRCPVATPICGWEVDDAVAWLNAHEQLLDALVDVERRSAFDATLVFSGAEAATAVVAALENGTAPEPMRAALAEFSADDHKVNVRFTPVRPVELLPIGGERYTNCVLYSPQDVVVHH